MPNKEEVLSKNYLAGSIELAQESSGVKDASVGRYVPILLDADGVRFDGDNRIAVDKNWPTVKLKWVKTEKDRVIGRINVNSARRDVSFEERQRDMDALANELVKEGVPKELVSTKIVALFKNVFSDRYVRALLGDVFKDSNKVRVQKKVRTDEEIKEAFEAAKPKSFMHKTVPIGADVTSANKLQNEPEIDFSPEIGGKASKLNDQEEEVERPVPKQEYTVLSPNFFDPIMIRLHAHCPKCMEKIELKTGEIDDLEATVINSAKFRDLVILELERF